MRQWFVFLISLLAVVVYAPAAIAATDRESGNSIEPGCRYFATGTTPREMIRMMEIGQCTGALNALMWLDRSLPIYRRFCVPETAGVQQAAKVVVKFFDAHPERLHENYHILMTDALREVWPCPVRN
jgi:hypothetical protein